MKGITPYGSCVQTDVIEHHHQGEKFKIRRTLDGMDLKFFVDSFRNYAHSLCEFLDISNNKIKIQKISTLPDYDVKCTIKKVDELFSISLMFYIPKETAIPDSTFCDTKCTLFGEMLHVAIQGESHTFGSQFLNWNFLDKNHSIKLKAKVAGCIENPTMKKIRNFSQIIYNTSRYFRPLPVPTVSCEYKTKSMESVTPKIEVLTPEDNIGLIDEQFQKQLDEQSMEQSSYKLIDKQIVIFRQHPKEQTNTMSEVMKNIDSCFKIFNNASRYFIPLAMELYYWPRETILNFTLKHIKDMEGQHQQEVISQQSNKQISFFSQQPKQQLEQLEQHLEQLEQQLEHRKQQLEQQHEQLKQQLEQSKQRLEQQINNIHEQIKKHEKSHQILKKVSHDLAIKLIKANLTPKNNIFNVEDEQLQQPFFNQPANKQIDFYFPQPEQQISTSQTEQQIDDIFPQQPLQQIIDDIFQQQSKLQINKQSEKKIPSLSTKPILRQNKKTFQIVKKHPTSSKVNTPPQIKMPLQANNLPQINTLPTLNVPKQEHGKIEYRTKIQNPNPVLHLLKEGCFKDINNETIPKRTELSTVNIDSQKEISQNSHEIILHKPQILPSFPILPTYTFEEELINIQRYGKLRGKVTSVISRKLLVSDDQKNTYAIPLELLNRIANLFLNEILSTFSSKEIIQSARTSLRNLEQVSRSWWKACSDLVIKYDQITLPNSFAAKTECFPIDICESIKKLAETDNLPVGILYLDPSDVKPTEEAVRSALPTFCGYHIIYDTLKPKVYPFVNCDIKYFKHPEFPWATTLIDFISWSVIENFSLLYIEDPYKRPALAMPYIDESETKGKGIFILQRFRVDENNKEWWLFIDRPLNQECSEARVVCFLYEYNKCDSFEGKNDSCDTNNGISKKYLDWLNNFLSGQICEDLPSSEQGYFKAVPTNRRIKHCKEKADYKV